MIKYLIIFYLAFSGICGLFSQTHTKSTAVLTGQVINGTTGKPVSCDWVRLLRPGKGMETAGEIIRTDHYEFKNLIPDKEHSYILRANYQSVTYSEYIKVDSARSYTHSIKVFDTSSIRPDFKITLPQLVFSKSRGKLYIEELYELHNESKLTYLTAGDRPTFTFNPLQGASLTSVKTQFQENMPLPTDTMYQGGGIGIRFPIRPGTSTVQIRYIASYETASYTYKQTWPYDLRNIYVFITPSDIQTVAENFTPIKDDNLLNSNFSSYQLNYLPAGDWITITLNGGSDRPGEEALQIRSAENMVQKYAWWIILFLISVFLIYIGWYAKNFPAERN